MPGFNIVSVFRNAGGGTFHEPVPHDVGEQIPQHLTAADLDRDGFPELAVAVSDQVFVFPNQADGSFGSPTTFPAGPPFDVRFLAAGDLDDDGDLEIAAAVCSSESPHLAVLRNDGGGAFGLPEELPLGGCPSALAIADLDGDGMLDLASANTDSADSSIFLNGTAPPVSRDQNGDGIPDECGPVALFHRGDPTGDGQVDLSDVVHILWFSFLAGSPPGCAESADADNDGQIALTDAVVILNYLFLAGPPPAAPGPPPAPCGPDPNWAGPGSLGCLAYDGCSAI